MVTAENWKERTPRVEDVFTLQLVEGRFACHPGECAQDMFPGVSTEEEAFDRRTMVSGWSR